MQNAAIGRPAVARLKRHHITRHKHGGIYQNRFTSALNAAFGCRHFFKRIYRLFGLCFLINPQHGIYQNNNHNNYNIRRKFAIISGGYGGNDSGNDKYNYHGIRKLHKEFVKNGFLFALCQPVFTVLCKAFFRLALLQARFGRIKLCQHI